ncbi:MAG: exodeoxyribonuclease VII large subunit [Pseudomonadota bacterium]|nr:exodeoxyribonuclease VII large subunit [Pseudomonadota bacterium]
MSSIADVITVSELNRLARLAIEKSLPSCWVSGEISNFTRASSGHWYFTLKDQHSGVRCAFFRNRSQFLDWIPSEGDKVEVRAQATLYEARGDYQLLVDAMRRDGQGALYEEFLRLKSKLEAEGLFRPEQKLRPPRFPKQLGVVTSLQAAALQDVLKTLELRWPNCPIVIYPASVQGSDAAGMIRQSLSAAISRNECDVILLIRGGGSLEDLLPFNDEQLARTIYSSPIPVITGIGHETDFSIADFVADVRAATPTAAAQLAVPDRQDINVQIRSLLARMNQAGTRLMYQRMQHLDGLSRRVLHPGSAVTNSQKHVAQIKRRLTLSGASHLSQGKQVLENRILSLMAHSPKLDAYRNEIENRAVSLKTALVQRLGNRKTRVDKCFNALQQLNPDNVLSRGYCIALNETGSVIRHAQALYVGDKVKIKLKLGGFDATVDQVTTA